MVTLANDALRAEGLTGVEAGGSYSALAGKLTLRGAMFGNVISKPIANVTLDAQPNLITRQRQNLGSTRQLGFERDCQMSISDKLTVSGGYQFVDSVVRDFPANPALKGLTVPHVPRNILTFQSQYSNSRLFSLGLQGRFVGEEFDDDQNQLPLDRCFTLDAFVSRAFSRHWEVFAAAENLLNRRCDVARTPVQTVGPPLWARVGLRFRLR